MSDFDVEKFLADARRFSDEQLRPRAGEFDQAGALPRELFGELGRRGYLGACLPLEHGGLGLDAVAYGRLTLEIGKGCPATRSVLTVSTSLVGETLARWGLEGQKARWLPALASGEKLAAFALTEPDHGSDVRGIETTYRKAPGGYVLRGRKRSITLGCLADVFLVVARAAEGTDLTAFLIERGGGVTTEPMTGLLASRAAGVAEVTLDDALVPAHAVVGEEGAGMLPVVASALDAGRYSVAWGGLAIAEAALESMAAYANERTQFGRRLSEFQVLREMIAEATVKVHAGRALCLHAGRQRSANEPGAPLDTTIAKYFTARAAMEVTTDAVQLHGANGCWDRYPVERLFREAKVLEIIEGTTQIHQRPISDYALQAFGRAGPRGRG